MAWGGPNLPLTIDLAVGPFGGGNGSGYFFDNVLLTSNPTIGSGTYDISFLNKGGAEPTLGRLLLSGGNVLKCVSANAIPEPPAITLFGIGFAGLFASRRRKMN